MHKFSMNISAYDDVEDASRIRWVVRIQEDHESYGIDRHWAGWVKLQDDPVVTAEAVLNDALEKTQALLATELAEPLFRLSV